jgi:hypothetical protein
MFTLKCPGCGSERDVENPPPSFCCKVCGLCVPVKRYEESGAQACECILPDKFNGWDLPVGKHESPTGEKWYKDSDGNWHTLQQWKDGYGFDPDLAKKRMIELGIKGRPGHFNCSTLSKEKKPMVVRR